MVPAAAKSFSPDVFAVVAKGLVFPVVLDLSPADDLAWSLMMGERYICCSCLSCLPAFPLSARLQKDGPQFRSNARFPACSTAHHRPSCLRRISSVIRRKMITGMACMTFL